MEENGYSCAICNDTEPSTNFSRFTSTCEHTSHTECVVLCIKSKFNTCPICRQPITEQDVVRLIGVQINPIPQIRTPTPSSFSNTSYNINKNAIKGLLAMSFLLALCAGTFVTLIVYYAQSARDEKIFKRTWIAANCTYIHVQFIDVFYLNYTLEIVSFTADKRKYISNNIINCDETMKCSEIYAKRMRSNTCYYNKNTMKDGVIPLDSPPIPENVKEIGEVKHMTIVIGILLFILSVIYAICVWLTFFSVEN